MLHEVFAGKSIDGSGYSKAAVAFVASRVVSLIHVLPDLTKITVPGWIERELPTGIKPDQVEAMHKAAFENVFQPVHELLARAGIKAAEVRLVGQARRVDARRVVVHVAETLPRALEDRRHSPAAWLVDHPQQRRHRVAQQRGA